jgi:protein-S-isoprenylcysteine O-methyltransferase Ste14
MRQASSLILPITVLVIIPYSIAGRDLAFSADASSIAGIALMAGGFVLVAAMIRWFAQVGKGTLAPWDPPKRLVTGGLYAHVRNPMITGVLTVLLGESLAAHSMKIFSWFLMFFIINTLYFILFEEPGLERRFGDAYREYKRNVPRWIPRLHPWQPGHNDQQQGR